MIWIAFVVAVAGCGACSNGERVGGSEMHRSSAPRVTEEGNMARHGWDKDTSEVLRVRLSVHGVAASVMDWARQWRDANGDWPKPAVLDRLLGRLDGATYVGHALDSNGELRVDYEFGGRRMQEVVFRDE